MYIVKKYENIRCEMLNVKDSVQITSSNPEKLLNKQVKYFTQGQRMIIGNPVLR